VAKLPDNTVSFKLTEKSVIKISYAESYFSVHTLPPDEFPILPKIKDGKTVSLSGKLFAAMIKQTIFSISSSEDKYVLNGVMMEIGKSALGGDNTTIRMVATDGYRLAKRGEAIKIKEDIKGAVIVPGRALQEIARIIDLDKDEEQISINFSADQIAFKYKDIYLISRLIQGQFPEYKQVLPKKSLTKITVDTKSFLNSAERAAVIAAGSANIVRFQTKNNKLHLFATTPDVGTVDEVIEADIKGEQKNQIAFNIRLITDVLKVVETDQVYLEFTENLGAGVIRQTGETDFLYIVMPIRTQEAA
jgi:DNA polymerase-3 subunit beta